MIGLGSNSQLGIGIAIRLQNQFSGQANRVYKDMRRLKDSTHETVLQAARDYRNLSAGIGLAAAGATVAISRLAEQGSRYGHLINQISIVGGTNAKKMNGIVNDLMGTFAKNPEEMAGALFENIKAGIQPKDLENITKYQVAVSQATDEMLEGQQGVAKQLIGITSAFQLPYSRFADVANGVTAAANATQASVLDLAESLAYSANVFHQLNIPMDESLAILGRLSQANIHGSRAGTSITNFMNFMAKAIGPFSTPKMKEALAMLHLGPKDFFVGGDVHGQMKDLLDIIQVFDEASSKLSPIVRTGIFKQLFQTRGSRGLVNLFGNFDPNKTPRAILAQIQSGIKNDIAITQAKQMQKDLYSDFQFLHAGLLSLRKDFAESIKPVLAPLLHGLLDAVKMISWFIKTPLGKVLAGAVTLITPLVAAIFMFRAAVVTLALVVRSMSMYTSMGGARTLAGGVLDTLGGNLLGRFGVRGGLAGKVVKNAAGRWMVKGGETISYLGRTLKGGQLLPKALAEGAAFGLGGRIGPKLLGTVGKFGPMLTKIGGTLFEVLGPLGVIAGAALAIKTLIIDARPKRATTPEELQTQTVAQLIRLRMGAQPGYEGFYDKMADQLAQKYLQMGITINIDGTAIYDDHYSKKLDSALNEIGINVNH